MMRHGRHYWEDALAIMNIANARAISYLYT